MATRGTQICFPVLGAAQLRGPATGADGWELGRNWRSFGGTAAASGQGAGPHTRPPLCVLLFLVGRRLAADGAAS
jgi:hypothetical protein